jgi:hypothetical protein
LPLSQTQGTGRIDPPAWDFFIAHAAHDTAEAETLFDLINPHARAFLDSRCIQLGDDWDRVLAEAQQRARVTVVLVSDHVDEAYYQREEIAAAITLAREDPHSHRVVPVFLGSRSENRSNVPYGLRLKHGLTVSNQSDLDEAAHRLIALLHDVESAASSVSAGPSRRGIRTRAAVIGGSVAACLAGIGVAAWIKLSTPVASQPVDDPGLRTELTVSQPCQGPDGATAMKAFALTVADPESLSVFVRENARVFADEGSGFRCLRSLMAMAKELGEKGSVDSESTLAVSLLRIKGLQSLDTIRHSRDADFEKVPNGTAPPSQMEIDLQLHKLKQQQEIYSSMLKALEDGAMTPIPNIR